MSEFTRSNMKQFLNEIDDFKRLKVTDQITVEQNLHNLIGNFNLIIDSNLVEHDAFLENLFAKVLGTSANTAEQLSMGIADTDSLHLTNYESNLKGYICFDYSNLIQPVNVIKATFENDVSADEPIDSDNLNKYQPLETDKTLVLLADTEDSQSIYDNYLEPFYGENIYVIVVDKTSLPNPVKTINNQRSSVLVHKFDRTTIFPVLEYSDISDKYNDIHGIIKEDILNKLENTKTFNELYKDFEKHILNIKENREELIKHANENKDYISEITDRYLKENLSVETLLETIETSGIKKKKNEQKEFVEQQLLELVNSINYNLQYKVEMFNEKTEESIERIEHEFVNVSGLKFGNKAGTWFFSGLAGLGSYGALSLTMTSFGRMGGSMLLTKGASLLTGFGLFKGGTAAAAILSGPVGISIGAAVATALVSKSLLGIGWKKGLAKQVEKTATKNVVPKIKENNVQLWDETKKAVKVGFDEIIEESRKDFIERNKNILDSEGIKKINEISNFS